MSKRVAAVLERAYHLLDDKRRWTTKSLARDAHGNDVESRSSAAVCWCAAGAVEREAARDFELSDAALAEFAKALGYGGEYGFEADITIEESAMVNDGPDGYRRIRAAFRRAIKAERA